MNKIIGRKKEIEEFTGKERDAESGYDYFGARFLSTQLGICYPLIHKPWLSVTIYEVFL